MCCSGAARKRPVTGCGAFRGVRRRAWCWNGPKRRSVTGAGARAVSRCGPAGLRVESTRRLSGGVRMALRDVPASRPQVKGGPIHGERGRRTAARRGTRRRPRGRRNGHLGPCSCLKAPRKCGNFPPCTSRPAPDSRAIDEPRSAEAPLRSPFACQGLPVGGPQSATMSDMAVDSSGSVSESVTIGRSAESLLLHTFDEEAMFGRSGRQMFLPRSIDLEGGVGASARRRAGIGGAYCVDLGQE